MEAPNDGSACRALAKPVPFTMVKSFVAWPQFILCIGGALLGYDSNQNFKLNYFRFQILAGNILKVGLVDTKKL